jgi:SAM-dependent methyltransferase
VEPSHFEFTLVAPDDATLPYERESVDCVVLFDVLEHLIDPAKTLGAVHEILRPNGAVISFTPLEAQPLSFYVMFRRLLGDDLYVTTKEHVQAFSERALRTLVEQEFTIRKVEYAYHLVSHFMDAFLFALMKSPWVRRRFWQDNPFYAEDEQQAGELSALGIALRAANAVAYAESSMLRHCRAGAAGMLFVATAR